MNDDRVYEAYHGIGISAETRLLTRQRVDWTVAQVPRGRILDVGCSQGLMGLMLAERGETVVGVDIEWDALAFALARRAEQPDEVRARFLVVRGDAQRLPLPDRSFDHAILGEVLEHDVDPELVLPEVFRVLRPGGTLVLTVPFGVLPHPDHHRVYYRRALLGLVEPLFAVEACRLLEKHLAVVATRRPERRGAPVYAHDDEEQAYREREESYLARIAELQDRLEAANVSYRRATTEASAVRMSLGEAERQREKAERDLERVVRSRGWRLIGWLRTARRTVRHALRGRRRRPRPGAPVPPARPVMPPGFRDDFDRWLERVRAQAGAEVVFMFSGTTFMQEKRGNRPIRLAREYLVEGNAVFFNYYRWGDEPIPPSDVPLLFQSPIDLTPSLIETLLSADLGGRRKVLFASFPHELMVRWLVRAAHEGWTTIYDARDDWEEFERVGAAKWYKRPYEAYIAHEADIATAVSRPLARKVAALADREVEVVPNALDEAFPLPPGPRRPEDPPVIGYFGHLTPGWFDWDLLTQAARRHPTWRFEIAGHGAPPALEAPPNVELLGLQGHADLAQRSVRWSLAIIPFRFGSLTEAVDPIKVYEYLHLGLPVLSTYMPQMLDYPGVEVAESPADFLDRLQTGVRRTLDETVVRAWLQQNTWRARIETYRALVADAPARSGVRVLLGAAR